MALKMTFHFENGLWNVTPEILHKNQQLTSILFIPRVFLLWVILFLLDIDFKFESFLCHQKIQSSS